MKYAKTFFSMIVLGSVAGCGVTPIQPEVVKKMRDRDVYGLVAGAGDAIAAGYKMGSGYCAEANDPACNDLPNFDALSVALARDWKGPVFTYMLVPKVAHVEKGDVIFYHSKTQSTEPHRFIRIAAKASEADQKHCGWVGSKILTDGGVECEGWSYKNEPVRGAGDN